MENTYPTTAVRYGHMNHIGEFSHAPNMRFTCGGKVVISTDRGIEIGQQVRLTCMGCENAIPRDKVKPYVDLSGPESFRFKAGRILREATEADLKEWKHIEEACEDKLKSARQAADQMNLQMKLVHCEHTFGGERIVFYFMSEERIDFRQLVQTLAAEYQTRIEMRQVGARDEARLISDYEFCGRECCCKSFLKSLKPVGMAMAKLQKTTLDLSKVSGRCGRLKCCLRFEHETYEVLDKKLPRMNSRIRCKEGTGQIVERQVLTQMVRIRQDDGGFLVVPLEEILETGLPPAPRPDPNANGGNGRDVRGRNARPQRPPAPRPRPAPKPLEVEGFDEEETEPESESPAPLDAQSPEGSVAAAGVSEGAESVVEESPVAEAPEPMTPAEGAANAQAGGPGQDGEPRRRRRGRRRRRRGPRGEGGAPPAGAPGPS